MKIIYAVGALLLLAFSGAAVAQSITVPQICSGFGTTATACAQGNLYAPKASPAFTGNATNTGNFYSSAIGTNAFTISSAGANYFPLWPVGTASACAGYSATITANGTCILTWSSTGLVAIAGALSFTGTIPVVTGTGTPTIATGSTDSAGEVTSGTTATSVVITFASSKTNAPFCTVTPQTQLVAFSYTISTTAITITQTATTGEKINYICTQR